MLLPGAAVKFIWKTYGRGREIVSVIMTVEAYNRKDWGLESFSLKNFLVYAKYAVEQELDPTIIDHAGLKRKHVSFIIT